MASSSHAAFHMEALRRQRIIDRAAKLRRQEEEKQQEQQKDATTQTEKQTQCSSYQSSEERRTPSHMSRSSRCSQQTTGPSTRNTPRVSSGGLTSSTGPPCTGVSSSRVSSSRVSSRIGQHSTRSSGRRSLAKSSEKESRCGERCSVESARGTSEEGEAEIPRKRKRITSRQKPLSTDSLKESPQEVDINSPKETLQAGDPSSLPQSSQCQDNKHKGTSRSHLPRLRESGVSE